MIYIGIGANLPSEQFGSPLNTCEAALSAIGKVPGLVVKSTSPWYESAPVPLSDQPWYINGVIEVMTALKPQALMAVLLGIEADFGRVRRPALNTKTEQSSGDRNAARILDLDILAYDGQVIWDENSQQKLQIPHPRMQDRAFVLLPFADIAPHWVHPKSQRNLADLIANRPKNQVCRQII